MLNELFTGSVPIGTQPRQIGQVAQEHGYLDEIVSRMLRQTPRDRPSSIAAVKHLIQRQQAEAVSLQRLSEIDGKVIKATEIDVPLADTPPSLINAEWDGAVLTLVLDRQVTPQWVSALQDMGSYSSVMNKGQKAFSFNGNLATIGAPQHEIQLLIDSFKVWLPQATNTLKSKLEEAARKEESLRREQLRRAKEAEELRLRVNRNIRI
jgi:hypothetical protein